MFYGALNLDTLAKKLTFTDDLVDATFETKRSDLVRRSVALTCPGYARVFNSKHASI